ncbi:MAG: UPF0175 family protein, partial [Anaerolineae bacterium]
MSVVEVSQDILDSARLTPSQLKVEMAVHLYEQGRLSVGKARAPQPPACLRADKAQTTAAPVIT